MKTFLIRNRHGREVHVSEQLAVLLAKNPSVKILGEVETKIEQKEIDVPDKKSQTGITKKIRNVATSFSLKKKASPVSNENDVEYSGNIVKKKSVVTKSRKEVKKSAMLDK